jgi:hypothetical protein
MNGATFREFADQVKHAYGELVRKTHDRDPTPMVILDTPGGVRMIGVDAEFFTSNGTRAELLDRFIVPAIGEHGATKAAWVFVGTLTHRDAGAVVGSLEVAVATVIDAEVHEVWFASVTRGSNLDLGAWNEWPPNAQQGRLLTPIQEALR